jgi:hypothetical protein
MLCALCVNCPVPLWLYTAEQLTHNVHNIATTTADKQTTKQTITQKMVGNIGFLSAFCFVCLVQTKNQFQLCYPAFTLQKPSWEGIHKTEQCD